MAEVTKRRQEDKKSLAVYRKEKAKLLTDLRVVNKQDHQLLLQVRPFLFSLKKLSYTLLLVARDSKRSCYGGAISTDAYSS